MIHLVHGFIVSLGTVGSGEEGSPLSANSSLAEITKLIQIALAAGVIYLIKLVKDSKGTSTETHGEIQTEIAEVRKLAKTNFETNRDMIAEVLAKVEALEKR